MFGGGFVVRTHTKHLKPLLPARLPVLDHLQTVRLNYIASVILQLLLSSPKRVTMVPWRYEMCIEMKRPSAMFIHAQTELYILLSVGLFMITIQHRTASTTQQQTGIL